MNPKQRWVRNVKESVTWMLCARQLPLHIPYEIALHIASYLYEEHVFHSGIQMNDRPVVWSYAQTMAMKEILWPDLPLCTFLTLDGRTTWVTGVILTFLLRQPPNSFSICVYMRSMRETCRLINKCFEMKPKNVGVNIKDKELLEFHNGNRIVASTTGRRTTMRGTGADLFIYYGEPDEDELNLFVAPMMHQSEAKWIFVKTPTRGEIKTPSLLFYSPVFSQTRIP